MKFTKEIISFIQNLPCVNQKYQSNSQLESPPSSTKNQTANTIENTCNHLTPQNKTTKQNLYINSYQNRTYLCLNGNQQIQQQTITYQLYNTPIQVT